MLGGDRAVRAGRPCTTIVSPAFKSLSAASTLFVTF
jgi:hypothetical protein